MNSSPGGKIMSDRRYCYQCGRPLEDHEVRRRDVATGASSGAVGLPGGGLVAGAAGHTARVDLCEACFQTARNRDERHRRFVHLALCGVLVAIASVIVLSGVIGLLVWVGSFRPA
jgi:hypothetical protein